MKDPVVTPAGRSYERSAIEIQIQTSGNDPLTRAPLRSDQLIPNRNLRAVIPLIRDLNTENRDLSRRLAEAVSTRKAEPKAKTTTIAPPAATTTAVATLAATASTESTATSANLPPPISNFFSAPLAAASQPSAPAVMNPAEILNEVVIQMDPDPAEILNEVARIEAAYAALDGDPEIGHAVADIEDAYARQQRPG